MILTLIRFLYFRQSVLRGMTAGLVTFVIGLPAGHAQTEATTPSPTCQAQMAAKETQLQFEKLKQKLETGFRQGLPAQLQNQLKDIRKVNDQIAMQLLDTPTVKRQELQEILKKTIAHIETFVAVIPKLAEQAPKVRDLYVLPLANLEKTPADCELISQSQQTVFKEIERINADLYSVQGLSPQKYIHFQEDLQNLLNRSLDADESVIVTEVQQKLPEVVHSLQVEVDRALPSFQLSAQYKSGSF